MQNETPPVITTKSYLNTFSLIHIALVAGVLAFGIVIFLQTENQKLDFNYSGDVMFFVVPIMAFAGVSAGKYLYKSTIEKLASKNTLSEKLSGFQTASVIKYALLEGPALFAIVIFMNDGNQYFLIIAMLLIGYLILQRPTRDKIQTDLKLEGTMKSEFQQEDKPLS